MIAGKLRDIITFIRLHRQTSEYGSEEVREETLLQTRAQVVYDRGNRLIDNGEIFHSFEVTFITWIHLEPQISETDEIAFRGRRYRIISITPFRDSKTLYIKTSLINE